MARSIFVSIAREIDRQNRAANRAHISSLREQKRNLLEQAKTLRAIDREQKREEKERQRQYIEDRAEEVEELNAALQDSMKELESILQTGLAVDTYVDFEHLKVEPEIPTLKLGNLAFKTPIPEKTIPKKPSIFVAWIPQVSKKYLGKVEAAKEGHNALLLEHHNKEAQRLEAIKKEKEKHQSKIDAAKAMAEDTNLQIATWAQAFSQNDSDAVAEYFKMILEKDEFPEGFPQESKVAYLVEPKQLLVEYDLPRMDDIISSTRSYRYVKSSDSVTESNRPETQRRSAYTSVIAQTALRVIRGIFNADRTLKIDTVIFNGYVDTLSRETGKQIRPCLITVRLTRNVLEEVDLEHAEPVACLRKFNASISKSPSELTPVRPILELNMIDPRFVPEEDILSTLDSRSNLMELTPSEFESLITNLFEKMGLDTRMTQASRDGGVDCVAFDPRPIFGGKVVIQAKRYKNTVGVSAVRDLFGTMQNEGASKGILVTTSSYGKAAFDFAYGKPLELLDGANLLYLLKEHSNIDSKIIFLESWKDAPLDNGI